MKTRLVITDLKRMHHQNVCIAGYTNVHQRVRPVSTGGGIPEAALYLDHNLENQKVYLRIGLAHGWKKFPERCYLQITGIYTFPDYLGGKNFSHYSRKEAS